MLSQNAFFMENTGDKFSVVKIFFFFNLNDATKLLNKDRCTWESFFFLNGCTPGQLAHKFAIHRNLVASEMGGAQQGV